MIHVVKLIPGELKTFLNICKLLKETKVLSFRYLFLPSNSVYYRSPLTMLHAYFIVVNHVVTWF